MPTPEKNPEEKFLITFSDLTRIFRESKKTIVIGTLVMSLLGCLWALSKPVEYKVEATFREKSPKPVNLGSSLAAALISGGTGMGGSSSLDSEAIATLKSRKLLQPVVERLGLQATVVQECNKDTYLRRIKENALVEYAYYNKDLYPVLPDFSCPLHISSIQYNDEVPQFLKVTFQSDGETFNVESKGISIGEGLLGHPFKSDLFSFTIDRSGQGSIDSKPYSIILWPMSMQADILSKTMKIETDKMDKNLLKFTYFHRNRHHACQVVNTMMNCYQDYLKASHDRQAQLQLAYLQKRREESAKQLEEVMSKHAQAISEDLTSRGFANSQKELEFLAQRQQQLKEKLLTNELEIKRLNSVANGKCAYYDHISSIDGNSHVINRSLEVIRDLKQKRDTLELALHEHPLSNELDLPHIFAEQQVELRKVQAYTEELNDILERHQNQNPLDTKGPLFNDPNFLIKTWHAKLADPSSDPNQKKSDAEQFIFYLNNVKHLFSVHEKVIKERITHQQNPSLEFQGIDLNVAEDLYKTYSIRSHDIESQIRRNSFILTQLKDPNFELSTTGASTDDSVIQSIAAKATELVIQLKDESNRSIKEQERIKSELALQRQFLTLHLNQLTENLKLMLALAHEKIFDLQRVVLELIHQKIFLLEKNLEDYIQTRRENLKQERSILMQHLNEIHQEMASLPMRWVTERIIEQEVDTNRLIVEEIAKMVESKNISHKLELIQSAPIDIAIPPIHPQGVNLLTYSLLGAFLGAFLSMGFILVRSVARGIEVSSENLKVAGQHVSGSLSSSYTSSSGPLQDSDLATLRRLHGYFNDEAATSSEHRLLLIEGKGPDYSPELAALLKKNGAKVLRLFLSFDQSTVNDTGLLPYLEGKIPFPTIKSGPEGDFIEAGGVTRFSVELLNTPAFAKLLNKLQESYDWIVAISQAMPSSAEAEILMKLFPAIAVSVHDEAISTLTSYLQAAQEGKKVSFVFYKRKF